MCRAHNQLVAGLSPTSSTTQSHDRGVFPANTLNSRELAGFARAVALCYRPRPRRYLGIEIDDAIDSRVSPAHRLANLTVRRKRIFQRMSTA
jgi:hypothetical protein